MIDKPKQRRVRVGNVAGVGVTNVNADDQRSFANRMEALIRDAGGPAALARRSGLSRAVIDKYREGKSDPSRARLIKLLLASKVNIGWLVHGIGPMYFMDQKPDHVPPEPVVDTELLARISDGISRIYKEENARLSPADLGRSMGQVFNKLVAAYDDPAERAVGLKLALEELRHDLRQAPAGDASSSKRSA